VAKDIRSISSLRALGAVAAAIVLAACSDARATTASEDLTRDLELANATTMSLASPAVDSALLTSLETKPRGEPERAAVVRRGEGTRAVASRTPTVRATPDVEPAADETVEELETLAEAPVPDLSEPVAVAPRPTPVIVQTGGASAGDYGTSDGGGIFGGGGRGGVIIRGGGVDGDNCELRTRGGRRGTARGPIYVPTIPVAAQPIDPSARGGRHGPGGFSGSASTGTRRVASSPREPAPRSRPTSRRGL